MYRQPSSAILNRLPHVLPIHRVPGLTWAVRLTHAIHSIRAAGRQVFPKCLLAVARIFRVQASFQTEAHAGLPYGGCSQ